MSASPHQLHVADTKSFSVLPQQHNPYNQALQFLPSRLAILEWRNWTVLPQTILLLDLASRYFRLFARFIGPTIVPLSTAMDLYHRSDQTVSGRTLWKNASTLVWHTTLSPTSLLIQNVMAAVVLQSRILPT